MEGRAIQVLGCWIAGPSLLSPHPAPPLGIQAFHSCRGVPGHHPSGFMSLQVGGGHRQKAPGGRCKIRPGTSCRAPGLSSRVAAPGCAEPSVSSDPVIGLFIHSPTDSFTLHFPAQPTPCTGLYAGMGPLRSHTLVDT